MLHPEPRPGFTPQAQNAALAKVFQTNRIIAYGMAASLLVYAVVVEILKRQGVTLNAIPPHLGDNLRFAFVFVSFAAYFLIKFARNKLLVKTPADTQETLLGRLTLVNIISLALSELPALLGLILFLGSGDAKDFYLLGIISLLLFYVFFPQYNFWVYWTTVMDTRAGA